MAKLVVELRTLSYFVAVAEELHFGRAARRLNLTQPPLSLQIRHLEEELGVKLFNRTKRRVEITSAGRVLLEEARAILARTEHAAAATKQADRGQTGRLALGFIHSSAFTLLPQILRRFRATSPGIELILLEMTTAEQIEALRRHRLDAGILRPPVGMPWLTSQVVFSEPFIVTLPTDHPLAAAKMVDLAALREEPFVIFSRHLLADFYRLTIRFCEEAGFEPNILQEAALIHTIVGLVSAGLGVALVPASAKYIQIPGVTFRPLAQRAPRAEIAVTWRCDDESPLLKSFLKAMPRR